jgi:5-methylcytosine-specific restriction endonuclease McrA
MGICKECVICKGVFVARTKTHICCSPVCAKINKGAKWQAKIGKATCTVCNKEYQPKSSVDPKYGRLNKYCSTQCRSRSNDWNWKKGQSLRLIPSRKGKNQSPVHFSTCRVCDKLFTSKRKTILCSDVCRKQDACIRSREVSAAKNDNTPKNCKECATTFIAEYGNKLRTFCSKECSNRYGKRVSKATRRARIKGNEYESVNPYKVFSRDKWMCVLCGVKTPRKLRGTIVDNAPELDHIIPIAQGGGHTYNNVQCACRKCNNIKADKIIGQLPMFA